MSVEEPAAVATPAISTVSLKLPPFWPSDPEVWFLQVEAQFSTRGITAQKTRFDYIVGSLSSDIATEVRDVLLKPPTEQPYDVLKAELIKRTAASEQRKLQQLIGGEELGDRKPTQLLRRMQQLLGDKLSTADSCSFLRELFLQRLPANVRMVLASSDITDIAKLAEMADKVMEVVAPTVGHLDVQPTETPPPPSQPTPSEFQQLRDEVGRLTALVQSLSTRHPRNRQRSSSQHRTRQHSHSPARPPQDETLCWYHKTFGDKAKHCTPPCSHHLNDQAQC